MNDTPATPVKYNAFISYKHGPIDSAVGEMIQKRLEHFHTPKDLKIDKKIERLFFDNGELSSSPDFQKEIEKALDHSEYLFVICSHESVKSPWVAKEVDYFISHHDVEHIIPVLVAGEPYETFPKQLDYNKVRAADIRGKNIREIRKRFNDTGIYDLAAPLLGVSFDSLKQRHKIYRNRIITGFVSVGLVLASAFGLYAYRQSQNIKTEYYHSLTQQSKNFAHQAKNSYRENDINGAIENALSGIHTGVKGWKTPAETEKILTDVLNIYNTPFINSTAFFQDGLLNHPNAVNYFSLFADEDRNLLFTCDGTYVYIWDANKTELIEKISPAEGSNTVSQIRSFCLDQDLQKLFILISGDLYCYDYQKHSFDWNKKSDSSDVSSQIRHISAKNKVLYYTNETEIGLLSSEDGSVIKLWSIPENVNASNISNISVSESGEKAVITVRPEYSFYDYPEEYNWFYGDEAYYSYECHDKLLVLDRNEDKVKVDEVELHVLDVPEFLSEDTLLLKGCQGFAGEMSYLNINQTYSMDSTYHLALYNMKEGKLWQKKISSNSLTYNRQINSISLKDGSILVPCGEVLSRVDLTDGKILRQWKLSSDILQIYQRSEEDFNILTYDGEYQFVNLNSNYWSKLNCFPAKIQSNILFDNQFFFILDSTSEINNRNKVVKYVLDSESYMKFVAYNQDISNDYGYSSITPFTTDGITGFYASDLSYAISGDIGMLVDSGTDQVYLLKNLFESDCNIMIHEVEKASSDKIRILFSDFCEDHSDHTKTGIYEYNLTTKEADIFYLDSKIFSCDQVLLKGEHIYYYYRDHTEYQLYEFDASTGEASFLTSQDEYPGLSESEGTVATENRWEKIGISSDGKTIAILAEAAADESENKDASILLYEIDKKKSTQLSEISLGLEDLDRTQIGFSADNKSLIIVDPANAVILDKKGNELFHYAVDSTLQTITDCSVSPDSEHIFITTENELIDHGSLKENEEIVASYDWSNYFNYSAAHDWRYLEDDLIAISEESGTIIYDYSENGQGIRTYVPNAFGYETDLKRFWAYDEFGETGSQFGYFDHLSVEELVEIGERKIN